MEYIWSTAYELAKLPKPAEETFISWARAVEEIHSRINLWRKPPQDAHLALQLLKDEGYTMGVVSNADGRVEDLLAQWDLAKYFQIILDSHIEGVEKPDPEIFHRALKRLELKAEETIFLGDFYSVDVVGARKASVGAVLMAPNNYWQMRNVPKVQSLTDFAERIETIYQQEPSPWV